MEVLKTVEMFGMETTLGNVMFGSVYLATDILSEFEEKKDAMKAIFISFFLLFFFVLMTQIDLRFIPSASDFIQPSFESIFGLIPRICLGSLTAFLTGNLLDVLIYDKLKKKDGDRKLWLRNNICTISSQLFDNFILLFISYLGIMEVKQIIMLSITSWIIEVIVALLDTPILYLTRKWKRGLDNGNEVEKR